MVFNLELLKEKHIKIREKARQEEIENIKEELINLILDKDLKKIYEQDKNRKIAEQSKRVIGHWVRKGIIQAEQNTTRGWYYFDRTESIWIDIITLLRKFGLDLDKIKLIRNQLFEESIEGFKLINFALMYSILKEPYLMLVFDDGKISVLTTSLYSKCIKDDNFAQHIVLNFFHLAKNIFPNNNFNIGSNYTKEADLTTKELKLLYYIRTGDFTDIKIRLNDGDVYLIEGKKTITNPNSIMQIINEKSYQNIEIKTVNGNPVHITSTEKIKLK